MDPSSDLTKIANLFYHNVWSNGEIDVIDDIIHQDYNPDWIEIPKTGPDQLKQEVQYFRSVFDHVTYTIVDQTVDGNKVWVKYDLTGVHNGPAWGFSPTRKPFKTSGVGILTIQDGKIIDRSGVYCMYDVFNQLGLIPDWFELSNYEIKEN